MGADSKKTIDGQPRRPDCCRPSKNSFLRATIQAVPQVVSRREERDWRVPTFTKLTLTHEN
jgi:hypothetical protein